MLFIVATPLGNLEDISIRQGRIILDADYILAENTESIGSLLPKLEHIFEKQKNENQSVIRYSKEREMETTPRILELLRDGKEIALVSEAGSPLISDPGYLIVSRAIKEDLPITVIPGPTALVSAIQLSGLSFKHFVFLGFLPKKEGELKKILTHSSQISSLLNDTIFCAYESPKRIQETLRILNEIFPESTVVVARELTKKFETVKRGKPAELLGQNYQGEICLVMDFKS